MSDIVRDYVWWLIVPRKPFIEKKREDNQISLIFLRKMTKFNV